MADTLFPMPAPEEPEVSAGAAPAAAKGAPRLLVPNRAQMELRTVDLESLLPPDHPARAVWEFVESLDLSPLYAQVHSVDGSAGRPAIDPRIYMGLWLYATLEGVGSARALERLTRQHDAYRWILGGVSVNHHSLSDFRVQHGEYLDQVLTQSVAVLMAQGLVTLKRVAQDGTRVRASAGAASFRRQPSLERCLQEAQEQVDRLRSELEKDPEATNRRQASARQRAVEDRQRPRRIRRRQRCERELLLLVRQLDAGRPNHLRVDDVRDHLGHQHAGAPVHRAAFAQPLADVQRAEGPPRHQEDELPRPNQRSAKRSTCSLNIRARQMHLPQ